MIALDKEYLKGFIDDKDLKALLPRIEKAHDELEKRTGAGNDYLGWTNLPSKIPAKLIKELVKLGEDVRKRSNCIVTVGIGGSYLGIKATLEYLRNKTKIPVYFAGHNISSDCMHDLLKQIKDKRVTLVIISKSGTTTEPAIAFRILKAFMEKKYKASELKKRIICVTDEKRGALRKIADKNGFLTYTIPNDVGGRFSILTPVGLVPLALAGVDIAALIDGAKAGEKAYCKMDMKTNVAYQYAAYRYLLFKQGKVIEMFASFYDNMQYVAEWWKQLFGESEGKDGKGIFPASTILSTDLHSMGQMMQDGIRNIFETFLMVDKVQNDVKIPKEKDDVDGFNVVAGKGLDFVNKQAYKATAAAHFEGGVPNMTLTLAKDDVFHLGELYYFYERTVAISGYLLEVNPFDQPGVEAYKKKMFALLGK